MGKAMKKQSNRKQEGADIAIESYILAEVLRKQGNKYCGELWEASQTQHLPSSIFCNNYIPYLNKQDNHPPMTQPSYESSLSCCFYTQFVTKLSSYNIWNLLSHFSNPLTYRLSYMKWPFYRSKTVEYWHVITKTSFLLPGHAEGLLPRLPCGQVKPSD